MGFSEIQKSKRISWESILLKHSYSKRLSEIRLCLHILRFYCVILKLPILAFSDKNYYARQAGAKRPNLTTGPRHPKENLQFRIDQLGNYESYPNLHIENYLIYIQIYNFDTCSFKLIQDNHLFFAIRRQHTIAVCSDLPVSKFCIFQLKFGQ